MTLVNTELMERVFKVECTEQKNHADQSVRRVTCYCRNGSVIFDAENSNNPE